MFISVIIPTLNRTGYLGSCLAALTVELGHRADAEVIVVDDGSSPAAREANRGRCATYGARYLAHDRNRGMAVARNTGLDAASGEWAVFIDDDVCVEKGWGGALDKTLATAPAGVAGIEGAVRGSGNNLWDREVEVTRGGLCLTCHIVYRRAVLARAGNFDPQFEHEGPFHEDQELAVRVKQFGAIVFEPSLRAVHLPRGGRLVTHLAHAPARIEKMLRADFYFWLKHPAAYHDFRHATSFWGTYAAVLLKYPYVTMKRRRIRDLLRHPAQTLTLALSCIVAQCRAWTLVPWFIVRALRTVRPIVWFAADIAPSSQGGVRRLMAGLARGLEERGIRTEIICNRVTARGGGYIGFSLRLGLRLLCTPCNRPGWIVARSTDAFFCALVKKMFRLKTRIVLQNHGWEEYVYAIQKRLPTAMVEHPATWKARLVRFPMLRATLAMADCCLCGTVDDMRWIGKRYPSARAKLRYVPNGVDVQPSCAWPDRPPHFLWVGTLTWRKNPAYAMEVFGHLAAADPQARLFLVGTGEIPATLTFCRQERIVVVPSVPMEEMESWYQRCPFLLHTARYEGGHPLAILEAMSHAMVPFVVPIPSVAEIVRHGVNGVHLCGSDSRADAAVIAATIANTELVASLGTCAGATAQRNRWERQAARLARVIARQTT